MSTGTLIFIIIINLKQRLTMLNAELGKGRTCSCAISMLFNSMTKLNLHARAVFAWERAIALRLAVDGVLIHASPLSPRSDSTHSPSSRHCFSPLRKVVISAFAPQAQGPLNHTLSPPRSDTQTSYLRPAPPCFFEYHPLQNGDGSSIGESKLSKVVRHSFPTSSLFLFSHSI